MIDPETARRWGRDAAELDPDGEGSILAGRPTPVAPKHLVDPRVARRQRLLEWGAIAAQSLSLLASARPP